MSTDEQPPVAPPQPVRLPSPSRTVARAAVPPPAFDAPIAAPGDAPAGMDPAPAVDTGARTDTAARGAPAIAGAPPAYSPPVAARAPITAHVPSATARPPVTADAPKGRADVPARITIVLEKLTRDRRTRVGLVAAAALIVLTMLVAVPLLSSAGLSRAAWVVSAGMSPGPEPSTSATPTTLPSAAPPLLRAGPVRIQAPGFFSWALLDRATGTVSGSPNLAATNDTASMIKAWIAADYLRLSTVKGQSPPTNRLAEVQDMIRNSDNDAAEDLFRLIGPTTSIPRLVSICRLRETSGVDGFWSNTEMSARDAVLMGACIADGRAAGAAWTPWLLNEMRHVNAPGTFGILQALPASVRKDTAIKNGWIDRDADQMWHVNCLAIGDGWILAVEQRYPIGLGLTHGADICESVARQLIHA